MLTVPVSEEEEADLDKQEMRKFQTHSLKQYCDVSRQFIQDDGPCAGLSWLFSFAVESVGCVRVRLQAFLGPQKWRYRALRSEFTFHVRG